MLTLTHSPFLKALGWSLLNSWWQFGILWLLFFVFIQTKKKTTPAVKHALALLFMSAGFLWFGAGLSFQYFAYSDNINTALIPGRFASASFYPVIYQAVKSFLENNLPYLSIFYLLVVAGFFVRFTSFFLFAHRVQTTGLIKLKPELRLFVQKLVQQLEITRKVKVWVSEKIDTPMVMGLFKPIVLIPLACINELTTKQLEAVLLHELAHIKRNDYLINLYIATVEILFFFNPFTKLLLKSLKEEREKSCDDWVLQYRFDPYQYASALFSLERSRSAGYSLAVAASGENKHFLLHRIERIMGINKATTPSGSRPIAYFFTIALLSIIALVNPGNLVIENLEKTYAEARSLRPKVAGFFEGYSSRKLIASTLTTPIIKEEVKPKPKPSTKKDDADNNNQEEDGLITQAALDISDVNAGMNTQLATLQSTIDENKDFSIKETDIEAPETPVEIGYPFVPNSSYSIFNMEDSSVIKLRVDKEKTAAAVNLTMAQAQKAMEKIDWNKIARQQKMTKAALQKLQKAITKSFKDLNWSRIYNEAVDSVHKTVSGHARTSVNLELEKIKSYTREAQKNYQSGQTELHRQLENYKNGAELQLQQTEKETKKKKVIVYL